MSLVRCATVLVLATLVASQRERPDREKQKEFSECLLSGGTRESCRTILADSQGETGERPSPQPQEEVLERLEAERGAPAALAEQLKNCDYGEEGDTDAEKREAFKECKDKALESLERLRGPALRNRWSRISAPLPCTVRRDFRRSQEMVHQPTNRNDEQMLFAGVQPPVKNTFLHYDVCASAYQVEQQVLRRHQTAPAKSARDVSDVETDSEDEGVTVPKVLGTVNELKTIVAVNDVTPNLLAKEDYPMPGSLCRHTTHDAFEHGQVAWEPTVFGQGEFEGHQNGMNGQALQEGLQWDGQMGGQTCGVLPMTSDTVMFVGVHPPVWMPPDDASFSGQGALPIHPGMDCSNVSMIPLIMQPPLPQPIDADSTMAADQMVAVTGEWANYYPAEKYELLPQQLQVAPTEVIPEVFDVQSFSNPFGNFVQPDVKCLHPGGVSESERFWDGLGVELLHQPQKIGRSANMDNVYWVVDATKLNDKAKVLVSPEFKIPGRDGSQGSFKMVMYPKDKSSFRQAGGQGFVQLKCESDTQDLQSCSLTFRMGICNGRSGELAKRDGPRNVVTWDFKKSLVCDDEEVKKIWNFKEVVDAKTRTFAVCIEILSVEA